MKNKNKRDNLCENSGDTKAYAHAEIISEPCQAYRLKFFLCSSSSKAQCLLRLVRYLPYLLADYFFAFGY